MKQGRELAILNVCLVKKVTKELDRLKWVDRKVGRVDYLGKEVDRVV